MENLNLIAKQMSELKPSEATELLNILKEEYNIEPVVVQMPIMDIIGVDEKENVQTEFDVIIENSGLQKLKVVKLVKDLTTLGLREAMDLVNGAPSIFAEGVDEKQAKEYEKQFTDLGASITIK